MSEQTGIIADAKANDHECSGRCFDPDDPCPIGMGEPVDKFDGKGEHGYAPVCSGNPNIHPDCCYPDEVIGNVTHTAGPWRVEDDYYVVDSQSDIICDGSLDFDGAEGKANAHFIAAAPDREAALAALVHEFEQIVAVPDAFTAYVTAKAALAKAKGES